MPSFAAAVVTGRWESPVRRSSRIEHIRSDGCERRNRRERNSSSAAIDVRRDFTRSAKRRQQTLRQLLHRRSFRREELARPTRPVEFNVDRRHRRIVDAVGVHFTGRVEHQHVAMQLTWQPRAVLGVASVDDERDVRHGVRVRRHDHVRRVGRLRDRDVAEVQREYRFAEHEATVRQAGRCACRGVGNDETWTGRARRRSASGCCARCTGWSIASRGSLMTPCRNNCSAKPPTSC